MTRRERIAPARKAGSSRSSRLANQTGPYFAEQHKQSVGLLRSSSKLDERQMSSVREEAEFTECYLRDVACLYTPDSRQKRA
jgi:hypothetical protein